MTIRSYLWGMRLFALAALAALAFVVFYVNPERDGFFGQIFFYVALFFSVTGIATLFLFRIRRFFLKDVAAIQESVGISFRQGVLIALAICIIFFLQSIRLLVWWDGGLVAAGVLLMELWFLSR
jgi:hypothetical protein